MQKIRHLFGINRDYYKFNCVHRTEEFFKSSRKAFVKIPKKKEKRK